MIEFNIESEDSSDHWQHFKPKFKRVLDLGCGRWCTREGSWENLDPYEFSPIYFVKQGAKYLAGIDTSIHEINLMKEMTAPYMDHFTFIHDTIESPEQIKKYIKDYQINAIKSDIEGAEIHFYSFTKEDFVSIDLFAIEYHSDEIKNTFLKKLPEWGFEVYAIGRLWTDGMGVIFAKK